MLSIGKLSRFPVWGGRDAELPSDKLPLFISLSQGDLDAVKHNPNMAIGKHNTDSDQHIAAQPKQQGWVRKHTTAKHSSSHHKTKS